MRTSLLEVILLLSEGRQTDQVRARERQELLIAELNHRVRNILSLVRSLISRTQGATDTYEDFVTTLEGRVQAIARAHDQLTTKQWGPVEIEPLVRAEAAAYVGGKEDRIRVSGPNVSLSPEAFNTFALVLHELITNADKYGEIGEHGTVELRWGVDVGGDLLIMWRETGGPPVQAPLRKGFGTTIIERSIDYDLGGRARTEYRLTGFEAEFTIPARYVTVGTGTLASLKTGDGPAAVKIDDFPKTVLLVEDSMLIALDIEDTLRRLGAETVVSAGSVRLAREAIADGVPDFAVLDINLGAETSIPVAEELTELGVPFVFASGYGEQTQLGDRFGDVPVVAKPYGPNEVAAALSTLRAR